MDVPEARPIPAFTELPTEIHILIVEELADEGSNFLRCINDFPNLKNLRLACRQYAYLPRLLSILFHGVRLLASPRLVELAQNMDMSKIKPHVKRIAFEPTKYSWNMTYDLFREIIFQELMEEAGEKEKDKFRAQAKARGPEYSGMRWSDNTSSVAEFINKYMEGKAPFPEDEVNSGYGRYMAQANLTRQVFENGKVKTAWENMLRQLPEAKMFRIGMWDYGYSIGTWDYDDPVEEKTWKERGCNVYGHRHGMEAYHHDKGKCRSLQEPVAEALVNSVLSCLHAAGSSLEQLDMQYIANAAFTWADNGRLVGLDLSKLHTFIFRPRIAEFRIHNTSRARIEWVYSRFSKAIAAILRKSATSLRILEISPSENSPWEDNVLWPNSRDDIVALPMLGSFKTCASLHISHFARFLRTAPKLERLDLWWCEGREGEWREIWRAIRYHPRRMLLDFDYISCNGQNEINMKHFTGEDSKYSEYADGVWRNLVYDLEMYLSNKGEWNNSCGWFDNWDGDDEGSDDGGDETEEEEKEFWRGGNDGWEPVGGVMLGSDEESSDGDEDDEGDGDEDMDDAEDGL
ncbi:hypothetical protein CC80DRAFT_496759 [Byssothecium circinans]|uniref:Uncharacterized protein n=1 Tax=Byssothecium circinans TaxID=147558 RepID=A0A6A5TFT2_9PLEO|nr:hypothetical protein CC80DRAFT_496759 [Byssothecium circinans]